jgi:hypothetical protein
MALVGTINGPNDFGFKNRLINGAFANWQRGTTLTGTGAAAAQYLADRWGAGTLTSAFVMSRNTSVPTDFGFPYSLKIQRSAAQTSTAQANVIQVIESNNMYGLAGQTVTLSFWAKCGANYSAASSVLGVIVQTGTVVDQSLYNSQGLWTGAAYPVNNTATLTTSWQKFTYTATISSSALGMCVYFYMVGVGTAGADDSFFITGVQLEEGSIATAFDFRPFTTELQLCQRYYMAVGVATYAGRGGSTISASFNMPTPVTMRIAPTITGTTSQIRRYDGTAATGVGSATYVNVGLYTNNIQFGISNIASVTDNAMCFVDGSFNFNSEL